MNIPMKTGSNCWYGSPYQTPEHILDVQVSRDSRLPAWFGIRGGV